MNPDRCPVVTSDFEIIHRYLSELSLDELIYQTEDIFDTLSPTEKVNYDISRFCSSYCDVEGRINFVRALIDNAIISTVHIPFNYNRDERLINLLKAKQYDFYLPMAQGLKEEAAALTDDLEQVTDTIKVTNPRWEHVDETRKENSPKVASVGDTVMLMVDVTGFKGQWVTFDIFDKSSDPAMRIETVKGKIVDGTARKEWVVTDPNERASELKLEFEGSARSKSSGRSPIPLSAKYTVELKDEEGNPLAGIRICFTVDGNEFIVETDESGSAVQPAVGSFEGPADVTILWDNEQPSTGSGTSGVEDLDPDPDAIEILVVDDDNQPVEGAEVTFSVDGEDHVVFSDNNGHARLEHPDADEAIVTIRMKPGQTEPAVEDASPHSDIRARALTDDQVREALQYHVDQGDIALTVDKVPEDGSRVNLSENKVAGVTIMQLVDPFARGTDKSGDSPGQKHERDKFSCKPLTSYHRSLLNQRHALALVRLCKNLLAPNGFKVFYTQGLNGDTSRKDCHGWGTAMDFGGASTELPPEGTTHTIRIGVDFIVYLHWGLIPMWKPTTVDSSSNPTDWERLASWTIDDGTDFTQNPPGKKLHYRLDPPPYQEVENGKEPSSAIKNHFKKASKVFKDIYTFAVEQYSDATDELGPGVADSPTTEIDSHDGHFVLHPDYPKPNEPSSKYGRNAHNNHLHMQMGKTKYGSTA